MAKSAPDIPDQPICGGTFIQTPAKEARRSRFFLSCAKEALNECKRSWRSATLEKEDSG